MLGADHIDVAATPGLMETVTQSHSPDETPAADPPQDSQFESLISGCQRTSLIECVTTKIELKAIAAAAITGLNKPPAATGIAITL